MLRSAGPPEYKRALVVAGAAVGVGLIAYRIWSCRRPPANSDKLRTRVAIPPVQKLAADDANTKVKLKTSEVQEPTTDNKDVFVSTAAKENFSINPEVTSADVLSVSGTFVKVSPSASPVSFEEIGTAYVEPMSLPSTPPLIIEPNNFKSSDPSLSAYDQLNSSSMSFVAISSEHSATHLPLGGASELPLDLDTTLSEGGHVSMTEKNDMVVVDTSSEHSSHNSSHTGDEDSEVIAAAVPEQPGQSTDDAPEAALTHEIVEHGIDSATLEQSNE